MTFLADDFFVPEPFFISFAETYLHGDILQAPDKVDVPPELLFLHGASRTESRAAFQLLRQFLLNKYQVSSCAFDFTGHGGTGGVWGYSSIEKRKRQAVDVMDACFDCQPLSIVGVGMGAHIALKMASECPVTNLVLIMPEFYPDTVCTAGFCEFMCEPETEHARGWENANAIRDAVQHFQGRIGIITSAGDKASAQLARDLQLHATASAKCWSTALVADPMDIMSSADQQADAFAKLARAIADVCREPE